MIMRRGRSPINCWRARSGWERKRRRKLYAVIPGQPAGLNPESRDSGFDAMRRPGMTVSKLLLLLAERRAERMPGIHAHNPKLAREEFQLLQRKGEVPVLGMT